MVTNSMHQKERSESSSAFIKSLEPGNFEIKRCPKKRLYVAAEMVARKGKLASELDEFVQPHYVLHLPSISSATFIENFRGEEVNFLSVY